MLGMGDVGDLAKDDGCNGEPGGIIVCSDDPSVDEEDEDDDEDVAEEVDEDNEDADNKSDVDDMTVEEESAPSCTSTDFPGMANWTCHVCGACASMSGTRNISDTMWGNVGLLTHVIPAFRLPANGDTGVGNIRLDIATSLWNSEYVCRGTVIHM
jgi:hypothetical protein